MAANQHTTSSRRRFFFFFSGVPLMECCRAEDTSAENTVVGLPPGWVDTDVSWLYIALIPLSQVVRGCPQSLLQSLGGRSNILTAQWWSCLESECDTVVFWQCLGE